LLLACGARTDLLPGELQASCPGLAVDGVRLAEVEQMDLLFVIDNSMSMADKQELLRDAVPALVRRLVNPVCVGISDPSQELALTSINDSCPAGYRREFEPLEDMHIGVITSSLGSAGGDTCTSSEGGREFDDRAHLLATLPRADAVPSYQGFGFLDWDPKAEHLPPGEADIAALEQNFGALVSLAGEAGCGYEAPLEAWYRFLVDPAPAEQTVVENLVSGPRGIDQRLLAQRARFLRPDSLVAVIMLSDENDCSIIQHGSGWVVGTTDLGGRPFSLSAGTSSCAVDPNDRCCRSCTASAPVAGCPSATRDPNCSLPPSPDFDHGNLRCFDQKRRFGFDLLYPTARYAVGLRSRILCPNSIYEDADCTCSAARDRATRLRLPTPPCTIRETGEPVANPLFQNLSGAPAFERDGAQIFLAGIVGVPWQDLATPETLTDPARLEYLTASELSRVDPALGFDRWQLILGDPVLATRPLDPFMRESIEPRTGVNPVTMTPIVSANSTDPQASPINGHERDTQAADLQYACTFPLSTPRECATADENRRCDCRGAHPSDPICQPASGGNGGTTQRYAKAYPSLRQLDVLRQHGANSVVASICPKSLSGASRELEFGYRPAIAGLIKRLHCASLDGEFDTDPFSATFGTVNCRLLGVTRTEADGNCKCDGVTRFTPGAGEQIAIGLELERVGLCGRGAGVDCSAFCACEIPQSRGSGLSACHNDSSAMPIDPATFARVDGWCYVDPAHGFGSPNLVKDCPAGNLRNLRLLGSAVAQTGERLFSVCGDDCSAR
jgi:hypothetical protein